MTQSTDGHNMSRSLISLLVFAFLCSFAGAARAEPHAPTTSPGVQIGITAHDMQHYAAIGRQVAKNPGANTVHFCWTTWDHIPASADDADRSVHYNSYDIPTGSLNQGATGIGVSRGDWARAGFCRMDTDSDNLAHMVFHQREIDDYLYNTWHLHFPVEGGDLHSDTVMMKPGIWPEEIEMMWPDVAVEQNHGAKDASTDIWHVIALGFVDVGGGYVVTNNHLWYWRYDAGAATPVWEGPVIIDSTRNLSYTLDADDNSDRVCLVYTSNFSTDGMNSLNNVAYRETQTSGLGWIHGVELGEVNKHFATCYSDPAGPQVWIETSVLYDHTGELHILYTEQRASGSEHIALKHWRKSRGTVRPVVFAWYDTGGDETLYDRATWGRVLNIGFISLSVGDGSTLCDGGAEDNTDYLYAVYGKLCGETLEEHADTSALGLCNAELYLTVSRDHGDFWSNPINLTNT
ncbi:MAG TPA: hypothetical protein VM118_04455, partial [Acidobacteriota bacterium]|nr:hypothetical protein [Acidobacteriota bacterium]